MIERTTEPECFVYHLEPGRGADYDRFHADVWPEVVDALRLQGVADYRIYRRGDLVISVLTRHSDRPAADLPTHLADRSREWSELMAPLFTAAADRNGDPLFASCVFDIAETEGRRR